MRVTVYTTKTCAYCAVVKRWLNLKNVKYHVIELDDDPKLRATISRLAGATTVPITLVERYDLPEGNGMTFIVGYNPGKLAEATAQL